MKTQTASFRVIGIAGQIGSGKTEKYTGRKLKRKVGYKLHFPLNKFGQKKLVEKHGLYILQFED